MDIKEKSVWKKSTRRDAKIIIETEEFLEFWEKLIFHDIRARAASFGSCCVFHIGGGGRGKRAFI